MDHKHHHLAEHLREHVREHRSALVRGALIALGTVCLALGLVGLFLPIMPTTPFILLAAACYARGSARFYGWLVDNRAFGPIVLEWRAHRSIPWRVKIVAIATMAVSFAVSILVFVRPLPLQLAMAAVGVGLGVWLYRIPSRDRPGAPVVETLEVLDRPERYEERDR